MAQDWKTLTLVVLGAGVAGWLVVRVLSSGAPPRHAPTTAAAPTAATAPIPEGESDTGEPPAAAVAAPARTTAAAPSANEGDESALIERDLAALAQALVRDQLIEDHVMPRIDDGLDVPGVITYRRDTDFWEPALVGTGGTNR